VVGVDNLGSCTLARSRVGHPLQRIDPAALGEGVQAHRQYLHCPHQVEPRWFGWLTAPHKKEQLLLYLAATTHVVSTAIVVERQEEGHA
jgi:hypothetical protein